jgi:sugar phosphate isomerase/epimerase
MGGKAGASGSQKGCAITRRAFLATSAALGCTAATPGFATPARRRFFAGHGLPIGLQLYTLGDAPYRDLDGTLQAVARIGYRTVEGVGFMKRTAAEFRAALDRAGLSCPSTHVPLEADGSGGPSLAGDPGPVAADMHRVGVKYVVVPIFVAPQGRQMRVDDWRRLATQLNVKGAALKREGLRLGYHNHNVELTRLGSKTALDLLIENTDPALVCFEMDVGWVAAGGADPIRLLRAHPHRFRLMHVKDLKASTIPNNAFRMDPADVGAGSLDWKAILPVAYDVGVRYYYVEQEPPFAEPRMQAARTDYDYLARLS